MNESPETIRSVGVDPSRAITVPDPRPIYIGPEGGESFGILHEPAGSPSGCAVLICPPFGNSDNGSYMPRRTWAQHLAAAGRPALRFDLPATGDSPGSPHDSHLLDSWVQAVTAGATWLRQTYGLRTAAIGLGLGGLLACLAIGDGAPIDDLVLWAVPSRGHRFMRELRMFEAMLASRVFDPAGGGDGSSALPAKSAQDGSLESAGFVLSAETVAALDEIDLTELVEGAGAGCRTLLLERDGIDLDARLRTALERWGAEVQTAPGPGFWRMMAPPYESEPPHAVMATIDAWLAAAPAAAVTPQHEHVTARDVAAVEFVCDGAAVREAPVVIDHDGGRLLGVLTEPLEQRDRQLTLVLVNSGTLRRVGPNRMWAELARRWAARGVTAFRFDLARESDLSPVILSRWHPAHARPGDLEWDHFDSTFPQHYAAVLDQMQRDGLGDRFVLVGLSSGAYWSLDRLREDDRVAAAILINCPMLHWSELDRIHDDIRKLRDRETWSRILRGDVPTERIVHAGRAAVAALLRRSRLRATADEPEPLSALLTRLRAARQQLTFLFAAAEPLRLELERTGAATLLHACDSVTIEHLDSPLKAHVLESVALQRDAHAMVDAGIERALQAEADRAGIGEAA